MEKYPSCVLGLLYVLSSSTVSFASSRAIAGVLYAVSPTTTFQHINDFLSNDDSRCSPDDVLIAAGFSTPGGGLTAPDIPGFLQLHRPPGTAPTSPQGERGSAAGASGSRASGEGERPLASLYRLTLNDENIVGRRPPFILFSSMYWKSFEKHLDKRKKLEYHPK